MNSPDSARPAFTLNDHDLMQIVVPGVRYEKRPARTPGA